MASLGFRTLDEMVGPRRSHRARAPLDAPARRAPLDFADVLMRGRAALSQSRPSDGPTSAPRGHPWPSSPDRRGARSRARGRASSTARRATHADRAHQRRPRLRGAAGGRDRAQVRRARGCPTATVVVEATGTAGQSFGAFATRGMLLVLEGDANDYVGKGLSGGVLAIRPPARARFKAHENVIVGNTVPLRRDERQGVLRRARGRALRGAQQRRARRRRGRRRPRVRVHDRRHGRRARARRAATSPRG